MTIVSSIPVYKNMDSDGVSSMVGESKAHSLVVGGIRMLREESCPESLGRVLRDHYRCPNEFVRLGLISELSDAPRKFRFNSGMAYGRVSKGIVNRDFDSETDDAQNCITVDDGILKLPFDPSETVDNLRLERYATDDRDSELYRDYLRKLYYRVRPLTTLAVRKKIQRFHARNWRNMTFPVWPVDTTVENLCESVLLASMKAQCLEKVPFIWFWPRGARGCVMMTHDVETRAGRDFCKELMEVDDAFGVKASFQLVPEDRYRNSEALIRSIRENGFEVGIQDLNHDGRLFDNKEQFLSRASLINQYGADYGAKGFRAAVLYRKPEWFESLNFSFDMSIPNVGHLDPQGGGCCTVLPYFIGDILELPVTTTQDYTLFHILNERSLDLWEAQIELIFAKNGLASFIVHPDYVNEVETMSVYRNLLAYLSDLRQKTNIWFGLPSEIDAWWRARSKMSIVRNGECWTITGEGADQAVLAFGKIQNGSLVYEVAEGNAS